MNRYPLEPGLLSIFRLFVVLRLILVLLTMAFYFAWSDYSIEIWQMVAISAFVADVPFLFWYLSWGWFQRQLGRYYLPIAILIATVSPLVEMSYVFPLYNVDAALAFLLIFLLLLIPLLLVAWQYPFSLVLLFSLSTSVLEFSLLSSTPQFEAFGARWAVLAMLGRSVLSIFVGYIVSYLVHQQREQRRELAEANRKLVRYASTLEQLTVSRERNRLARELHDTLAHALSGLVVQIEAIDATWEDRARARELLGRALSLARIGLDETRRALQALRAAPLEELGLVWAIRELAETVATAEGLQLTLDLPSLLGALPPEVEQCYYRVAQEALANVSKHARARHVSVSLTLAGSTLTLTITDDGQGFDPEDRTVAERFGVRGMRERAELIGGTLQVTSRPGQGTTVRLTSEVY